MYLRSSYLELTPNGDVLADFENFLAHAKERGHAVSTGVISGSEMDGAILLAEEAGFVMWAPEITAKGTTQRVNCFVMVRSDFAKGEVEKFFELSRLSATQTGDPEDESFADPVGFVAVAFETETIGRVHLGFSPYLDEKTQLHIEEWVDDSAADGVMLYGTPTQTYPLFKSERARIKATSNTTQGFERTCSGVYLETTFSITLPSE